jgi:hypothetical protein
MEVIGQEMPQTLYPRYTTMVHTEKEAWWISELVWTIYSSAKYITSARI